MYIPLDISIEILSYIDIRERHRYEFDYLPLTIYHTYGSFNNKLWKLFNIDKYDFLNNKNKNIHTLYLHFITSFPNLLEFKHLHTLKLQQCYSNDDELDVCHIPKYIRVLQLHSCLTKINVCISKLLYLHTLDLSDNKISKIENLPCYLNSLNLENNFISKIENLPCYLKSLNISNSIGNNVISKIENLPVSLRSLNLEHN